MVARTQASVPLWREDAPLIGAEALKSDAEADAAVVGCGIAGLSVAYELARAGLSVIALDRAPIGYGMTGRSTAHLASVSDDGFSELIRTRGVDVAQGWRDSQVAAIDRIEQFQNELGINCDFKRVQGILMQAAPGDSGMIDDEFDAARKLGVAVSRQNGVPMHGEAATPALVYEDQARVDPLRYLHGLAKALLAADGRIYLQTNVREVSEDSAGARIETTDGLSIRAAHVVVATNAPINDRMAVQAKQAPYRTYAMAFRSPRGALPDALYWDTADPYHYVRIQPLNEMTEAVIVGGEDHKSGEADDAPQRFTALTEWTRERLPQLGAEISRWSGQVLEPADGIAFIGKNPGESHIYIATGDSGQGITHGAVAGLVLRDLIVSGDSPWSRVYDPSRRPLSAASEFLKENLTVVKNFADYLSPGEVASVDQLQNGQGAIIRKGIQLIAAYRDEQGELFLHSASCTHLGCHVRWNSFERCWDCPCHGSQFSTDGEVISAPAITPLTKASL